MELGHEKEVLQAQIVQLTQERDDACEAAEIRRQGWIMANHNAFHRDNVLQEQLEELQVEYHCLNNCLFPIPQPIPRYPNVGGPQVIKADEEEEDVQMNVNAAEPANEEEEEDPEEVQGISDVDSDHFDE